MKTLPRRCYVNMVNIPRYIQKEYDIPEGIIAEWVKAFCNGDKDEVRFWSDTKGKHINMTMKEAVGHGIRFDVLGPRNLQTS